MTAVKRGETYFAAPHSPHDLAACYLALPVSLRSQHVSS